MKSEKAKKQLNASCVMDDYAYRYVHFDCAVKAVELAEQEAEERYLKEIECYKKDLEDSKRRELLAQNIISEKRKDIERLQELKDQFDCDKYHAECNHEIELQELKNKAVEAFKSTLQAEFPESVLSNLTQAFINRLRK